MSITRILAPFIGAAVLSIASGAWAEDGPATAPLGDFFGIRTVEVAIGGKNHTFLLDTGGGVTTISPALAEAVGCTPWAQISGHRMTGERLTMPRCDDLAIEIGGRPFTVPNAGVFDLGPLLPPGSAIDGLVGLDILTAQPFTLELTERRLTFETPGSLRERIAGAIEIPIRMERQAGGISLTVMAAVTTAKGTLWMLLDSGSDAAIQVAPSSAAPLGLDPEGRGQTVNLRLAGVNGPDVQAEGPVRVRDIGIDGNIGAPVLSHWVMTFDLANLKLWIRDAP